MRTSLVFVFVVLLLLLCFAGFIACCCCCVFFFFFFFFCLRMFLVCFCLVVFLFGWVCEVDDCSIKMLNSYLKNIFPETKSVPLRMPRPNAFYDLGT